MSNTLHLTATVLPGLRIEVPTPDFKVGDTLDVVLSPRQPATNGVSRTSGAATFLKSLPPRSMSPEQWEQFEREFREDRESWDRDY